MGLCNRNQQNTLVLAEVESECTSDPRSGSASVWACQAGASFVLSKKAKCEAGILSHDLSLVFRLSWFNLQVSALVFPLLGREILMPARAVKYLPGSQGLDLSGKPAFVDSHSRNQDLSFIRSVGKAYPNLLSLLGFLDSIPNSKNCTQGEKLKKYFFRFCSQGALQYLCCICIITVVPEFIRLKS